PRDGNWRLPLMAPCAVPLLREPCCSRAIFSWHASMCPVEGRDISPVYGMDRREPSGYAPSNSKTGVWGYRMRSRFVVLLVSCFCGVAGTALAAQTANTQNGM